MLAEIIAIGDELLSGAVVDTNSSYLDGVLADVGFLVRCHTTVGDDVDAIASAIVLASQRSDLVLTTGGLGPTSDDVTFEALARALGCALRRDDETLERIRARFFALGREMTPNNERQAWVPERGEVIANDSGTAPAFCTTLGRARVFAMPGIPREMRWLMVHAIGARIGSGGRAIVRRTIRVIGIGESRVEHEIRDIVARHRQVRFGFRTMGIENHVVISSRADDAARSVAAVEDEIERALGDRVFGKDDDELAGVAGRMLRDARHTVSTAESCTAGFVAKMLTDIPGSSAYFRGGIVAYDDAVKVRLLGVSQGDLQTHGAVSEPVVARMAEEARARFDTTWGLATSGIAGPGGATESKPVGLVCIAVAGPKGTRATSVRFPGDREFVRTAASKAVIQMLRNAMASPTDG